MCSSVEYGYVLAKTVAECLAIEPQGKFVAEVTRRLIARGYDPLYIADDLIHLDAGLRADCGQGLLAEIAAPERDAWVRRVVETQRKRLLESH